MKQVTLTFDNGPSLDVTPQVLDVLAEFGIKATFFVCGKDAEGAAQREILQRAKAEGHRLGNHTYSHTIQLGDGADPSLPEREIGRTQEILADLADEDRLFRPYGGGGILSSRLFSPEAITYLCQGKYTCVLWNSIPRDWEETETWPERALADIRRQDWTLTVIHDTPTGAMKQLPRFLTLARQAGVTFPRAFPPECVPIYRGEIIGALEQYTST